MKYRTKIAVCAMTATVLLSTVADSAMPTESALKWYEQGDQAT